MNTQPENGNDLAKELAARLAEMEAANHVLQEEVERKNKALEGFIAENEALKAELGGKGKSGGREETKAVKTNGAAHPAATDGLQDLMARARNLGW
jgi:hypothetical protein